MLKRIFTVFLTLILIFNLSIPIMATGTGDETAQQKSANFINFYNDSAEMELNAANLTTNDYYTLFAFLSNWFEPGITTLADLYEIGEPGHTSYILDSFVQAMGRDSSGSDGFKTKLASIVKSFAVDFFTNGVNNSNGDCLLVYRNNDGGSSVVTGNTFYYFLDLCVSKKIIPTNNSEDVFALTNGYKVSWYHGDATNEDNVVLDFNYDVCRATLQTLFAYNPDMFITSDGIITIKAFYVDCVGNIWGLHKDTDGILNVDNTIYPNRENTLKSDAVDDLILIMPACLNPVTFTYNPKNYSEIRYPLLNRFALGNILKPSQLQNNATLEDITKSFIPIYDLLAVSTEQQNGILGILGLRTLSPFTLESDSILEDTFTFEQRQQEIINFLYNPNSMVVKESNVSGIVETESFANLVFAMNPYRLKFCNSTKGNTIDVNEGLLSIPWVDKIAEGEYAIEAYNDYAENGEKASELQKKFFMYFFTPTIIPLNNVSMNLYQYKGSSTNSATFEDFQKMLVGVSNDNATLQIDNSAFTSSKLSQIGITAMNVYLEDVMITESSSVENGNVYDSITNKYYVTGVNMQNSLLLQILNDNKVEFYSDDLLNKTKSQILNMQNKSGNTSNLYKYLFRLKDNTLISNDFNIDSFNNYFRDVKVPGYNDSQNINMTIPKNYVSTGASLNDERKKGFPIKIEYDENGKVISSKYLVRLDPSTHSVVQVGTNFSDSTIGVMIGNGDLSLRNALKNSADFFSKDLNTDNASFNILEFKYIPDYILAYYAYSIFYPSVNFSQLITCVLTTTDFNSLKNTTDSTGLFFKNSSHTYINSNSGRVIDLANASLSMGVYLGYMVDMMGMSKCGVQEGVGFNSFYTKFLPRYSISAKGGTLSLNGYVNGNTGVEVSTDTSFEQKQKDLINRIYGFTSTGNNEERNSWIKSIIEGFVLTVHRTITGTWGSSISTVSTGSSTTYQSVTGYIYTPTLEELSFTAVLMNNYIKIYIFCMIMVIFLLILMILLNMRSWQQGVLIGLIMSVALLFPYILISNSISISNKISDNIYSDRFDFWAMSEHLSSMNKLQGFDFMSDKDKWLVQGSATSDSTLLGEPGVKIKWMAPKKVDTFQNLYSDASLSESFVTNMTIFKWLFTSFIYDSEFVDTDVYGSFVYRSYNNIALEAQSYYEWGNRIDSTFKISNNVTHTDLNGNNYLVPEGLNTLLNALSDKNKRMPLLATVGRLDDSFYTSDFGSVLKYSSEKFEDIKQVSQFENIKVPNSKIKGNKIGIWGMLDSEMYISCFVNPDFNEIESPGIVSTLPQESYSTDAFKISNTGSDEEIKKASRAIYLKNTESPFYYFYSVLKYRYESAGNNNAGFKGALLNKDIFKIPKDVTLSSTNKSVYNTYRDFLDLEGLFTYIIPYLKMGNDYVDSWQEVNGTEIEQYNFKYEVDEKGIVKGDSYGKNEEGLTLNDATREYTKDGDVGQEYRDAVTRKNAQNRVWNMYSPWVDSLYDLSCVTEKVSVGGKKIRIVDTLNPSYYISEGRPMIFSEADMIVKGYDFKDLTEVERKIQSVTEKTYKDLMYLINYYDMDNEVLLCAAAMYATFNFNAEFSENHFLSDSVMLYPQGFELKNFNYDAFMRLALLNSTGESVFATEDLYERVLSKTSIFTGLLLIVCDLVACVAIPMFKFVIIVGLLFLGILVCIACVVNPPDKIFEAVTKSLLLPTMLFMVLNIAFSWVMSFIVGEGLTAYVGSKTVNFATNDPTITMLIMALLGVVYLFFAWKVLKFLIQAYKQFGLGTAMAMVGIVGAAIAAGTAGVAKKAVNAAGRVGGAGIGAATAEKGHRLTGAAEGAARGTRGIIKDRYRTKQMKDIINSTNGKNETDKINEKAVKSKTDGKANWSDEEKAAFSARPNSNSSSSQDKSNKLPQNKGNRDSVEEGNKNSNNKTDYLKEKAKKSGQGKKHTPKKVETKYSNSKEKGYNGDKYNDGNNKYKGKSGYSNENKNVSTNSNKTKRTNASKVDKSKSKKSSTKSASKGMNSMNDSFNMKSNYSNKGNK